MDGTLVDTEPYWMAEEFALVESFGGQWSHELALALVGRALTDSAAYLIAHSPVTLSVAQVVDRLVSGVAARLRERGVPWRPGAHELLSELKTADVPTALVTMSYRAITDVLVGELPAGSFDVVVTGEDVTRGKPDPEVYAAAAAALGVAMGDCVAIEDSETGARSAIAAGVPTLVVAHVKPVPRIASEVHLSTLVGISAGELWGLATGVAQSSAGCA